MSNNLETTDKSSLLKNALVEIRKMRRQLDAIEYAKTEPIAIIGMGCRFPGGVNDPQAYWHLLKRGIDTVTEIPSTRWDVDAHYDINPEVPGKMYTRQGSFLDRVDQFDPLFFGITPREAVGMDPQQRLLLEVSWEALENAGQAPDRLNGSKTGVFAGIFQDDYAQLSVSSGNFNQIDAYNSLGSGRSIAVGRVSYAFGFQGPTVQVDTACSSSLVAIHLACQSLRTRECDLALTGGVNLMLTPKATIGTCKLKALAVDGRCKTFDASADGYGRGEGCGIVVLKRLSDAVANGDNVLAVIRGSAVNHDGRSNGLTAPNGAAQEALIRQVLQNAKLEGHQIQYVEAHGTGTVLGDPIEVLSLAAVLGEERSDANPLIVGSVKTNIGHLEGAAGVAALMKVVLSLQHGNIPPHLHLKEPNPHIPWEKLPITVPTTLTHWPAREGERLAGVSAFAMSGTNAHMILGDYPVAESRQTRKVSDRLSAERPLHCLSLSAKSDRALRELTSKYADFLASNIDASLADICYTTNIGRAHFDHRLAVFAASTEQLQEQLEAIAAEKPAVGWVRGQSQSQKHSKVAFLFTGQGAQYVGMGRQLYHTQPLFRQTLELCNEILQPYLDLPLLEILYPESGESSLLDRTVYTQPALFALEYALAQLWISWGIEPTGVMGHSVGEYAAACIAGVFSLEDGLKLIAERGRLIQALPPSGEMAVIFADEARVAAAIQPFERELAIAAINGTENIAISGKKQVVEAVICNLQVDGIKTVPLRVSHAFHSPLMEPMLAAFERVAKEVTYSPPNINLISNVTGESITNEIATPEYWCRHVLQPVKFAAGMKTLYQQGYKVFIETGPKPTLLSMGRQCLPQNAGTWLPSLRQGHSDWQQLLQSLGQLYVQGGTVNWSSFDRDYSRRRLQLPTYPFQRQRYWIELDQNYHEANTVKTLVLPNSNKRFA